MNELSLPRDKKRRKAGPLVETRSRKVKGAKKHLPTTPPTFIRRFKKRILLVGGQTSQRLQLYNLIRHHEYDLDEIGSVQTGILFLRNFKVDMVLADLELPFSDVHFLVEGIKNLHPLNPFASMFILPEYDVFRYPLLKQVPNCQIFRRPVGQDSVIEAIRQAFEVTNPQSASHH